MQTWKVWPKVVVAVLQVEIFGVSIEVLKVMMKRRHIR